MRFDLPQQRLQADLIWAASSVDMMHLESIQTAQTLSSVANRAAALQQWLHQHDHQTPLRQLIEQRQPRRLGIYFEVLWQYILENYPDFEFISRNLPVVANKRTLGEMDFLYFCKSRQRYIHLETAVKFYLGLPATNVANPIEWANWIGPGCIDRLDIKLEKMFNKQTQLSRTPEGLATLQQAGIDNVQQEICLKGYFFYPYSSAIPSPAKSHKQHARGYWLKQEQLHKLPYEPHWHIMKKEEWLSPVTLTTKQPLLNKQQLKENLTNRFATHKFPVMIANLHEADVGYKEKVRFFVTPNDWPQHAGGNS